MVNLLMRRHLMALVFLAAPLFGQNCDKIVVDQAGILGNRTQDVLFAADALINQGADVKVVTLANSGGNLDLAESNIERQCASWQGANGKRKSTLIALLVSKDRKLGIYYGSAWHGALDSNWTRIKTDYMVPRFRDGDYAGGFIAAEQQLAARLKAAKDEGLKPQVSQTVNQPTDFSGLWKVLEWIFGMLFLSCGVWGVFVLFDKRRVNKVAVVTAQQDAIAERNKAATGIKELEDKISTKEALGERVPVLARSCLQIADGEYQKLSQTLHTSPDTDGLTVSQYKSIQNQYGAINDKIESANLTLTNVITAKNTKKNTKKADSAKAENSAKVAPSETSTAAPLSPVSLASQPSAPQPTSAPYVPYTPPVVVVDNTTYVEPERPSHRFDEDSSSSSWGSSSSSSSSSSDSDSSGGGSSSWSSSDSSDSDDSGGSSSFDSGGSSDSGGGGSSDF